MAASSNGQTPLQYDQVLRKGIIGVRDWKPFARTKLKLSKDDIQIIEEDHKGDFAGLRYEMVMKWEERLNAEYELNHSNERPSPELLMRKMHQYHSEDSTNDQTRAQPKLPSPQRCSDFESYLKDQWERYKSIDLNLLKNMYQIKNREFVDFCELYLYVDQKKIWGDLTLAEKKELVGQNLRSLTTTSVTEVDNDETNRLDDVDVQTQDAPTETSKHSNQAQEYLDSSTSTKTWNFGDKGVVQELVAISLAHTSSNNADASREEARGIIDQMKKIKIKTKKDVVDGGDEDLSKYLSYNQNNVDVLPASKDTYKELCKDPNVYRIVHKPKGCVLILNNVNFKTLKPIRDGEHEGELLEKLFKGLGCKVYLNMDVSAADMKTRLTSFLHEVSEPDQEENSCKYDFCVVFILSHGERRNGVDGFFGSDDVHVPVKHVVDELKSNDNLSAMPKLLFLEMCRMNREHTETRQPDLDHKEEENWTPTDVLNRIFTDESPPQQQTRRVGTRDGAMPSQRSKTDHIMVVYSTKEATPAHVTHFTYALINVFRLYAKEKFLHQLLNLVKRVLDTSRTDQMADFQENMDKDFHFVPGFPK